MLNINTFEENLTKLSQNWKTSNYLLAVSGGVDSMALAYLFYTSGLRFQIAHVNYGLRGIESDMDEKLVRQFCEEYKIPFNLYTVSDANHKPQHSIQTWARDIRYNFFRKVQKEQNLKYLVTAHHLNDQLETFIINLSKASGIRGLRGIPPADNNILRPLLNFTKKEIYHFAHEHNIPFREDVSNSNRDYLRNKIRHDIVPRLTEINEHFLENFNKSLSYLNLTNEFVQSQIEKITMEIGQTNGSQIILDKQKLDAQSDLAKFEILRPYGFENSIEHHKIFEALTGSKFLSKTHQITVDRNSLIIENLIHSHGDDFNEDVKIKIEWPCYAEKSKFSDENISIDLSKYIIPELHANDSHVKEWFLDCEKIIFPIFLRHKKEGDYFYPFGMTGRKKISKFFKDEKIRILAKPKIWLLTDAEDRVLGVLPLRQDRRFVADNHSSAILKIKLTDKYDK